MHKIITRLNRFINLVGSDKILHCSVGANISFAVVVIFLMICDFILNDMITSFVLSFSLTFLVEVIKELLDDHFDTKDLVWTMGGWLAVAVFVSLIYLIV